LLEGALGKPTIVERAELRGSSTQGSDERERRGKPVEEEAERLEECQRVFGFALYLIEWMAYAKKKGAETLGAECGVCRVAVLYRHLESTTRRTDAFQQRSRPWHDNRETYIGSSPEVGQPSTFLQITSHLFESVTLIVVTETRTGDHAHCRKIHRC